MFSERVSFLGEPGSKAEFLSPVPSSGGIMCQVETACQHLGPNSGVLSAAGGGSRPLALVLSAL